MLETANLSVILDCGQHRGVLSCKSFEHYVHYC